MAKPHGLSTLIEAARFIEVGQTLLSSEKSVPDSLVPASISVQECHNEHDSSASPKGCLRHELQCNSNSNSSLPIRGRAFHSEEVRQDHNRMEKIRRRDMRKEFDDLKNRIPSLFKGKHSSVAVLQSAVEYIGELKELEKSLKSKHQLLYDQHKSLQQQLTTLQQGHVPCQCVVAAAAAAAAAKSEGNLIVQDEECVSKSLGSRKRKRPCSESSTISADSPKMFIGNRDEDFEVTEDQKLTALSKKSCNISTVCLSPSLSASSCLTVATPTPSFTTASNNHASPSSETTTSSGLDSVGLMSPPESCTSSASHVSNGTKQSQTASTKKEAGRNFQLPAQKVSSPKKLVAPLGKKVQPPSSDANSERSNSFAVGKSQSPTLSSPPPFPSPARPAISNLSTPVRIVSNVTTKHAILVGKQLAATFAKGKPPPPVLKRKMATIPFVANNAKVFRQAAAHSIITLPDGLSSSDNTVQLPPKNNKRPVLVMLQKRGVVAASKQSEASLPSNNNDNNVTNAVTTASATTKNSNNNEKTAVPVTPIAPSANVPVGRSICVVAGATATATVTPITFVTPVKPAQVVFLQPVSTTKICQSVVLLPAPTASTASNHVTFGTTTATIVKNNEITRKTVVLTRPAGESQQQQSRSPIVVLRPMTRATSISLAKQSPTVATTTNTAANYPVISVLSPPATPNSVVYSTSSITTGQ